MSERLVQAQRPLRILEAVKWDDGIEQAFFASGARQLPLVSREYYSRRPLPFEPHAKRQELLELERDIGRLLGHFNPAGRIMVRMCEEYRQVVDLLEQRGTPTFSALSKRLYGSAQESCHCGGPTLAELGQRLDSLCASLGSLITGSAPSGDACTPGREEPTFASAEVVGILADRLSTFFGDPQAVRVRLSDGMAADAAVTGCSLKVRGGALFTPQEVRMLEVHEGWVHLGTTLNALNQPVCTFLSKTSPSATVTQEGLAVLTEVLAGASYPARVRRLMHRVEAIARAEAGADFLDVYHYFLEQGYLPNVSYRHAMRVFRGSLPGGCGPFTKDLTYSKGFLLLLSLLRQAVARRQTQRLALLFCGKTSLGDVHSLVQLAEEGLLVLPRHVPPPLADLGRLSRLLARQL